MKPIKVDLSGTNTLGELFAVWQETQEQNGSDEQKCAESVKKSTFPDWKCSAGRASGYHPDFYKSFCYDGFITDWQGEKGQFCLSAGKPILLRRMITAIFQKKECFFPKNLER